MFRLTGFNALTPGCMDSIQPAPRSRSVDSSVPAGGTFRGFEPSDRVVAAGRLTASVVPCRHLDLEADVLVDRPINQLAGAQLACIQDQAPVDGAVGNPQDAALSGLNRRRLTIPGQTQLSGFSGQSQWDRPDKFGPCRRRRRRSFSRRQHKYGNRGDCDGEPLYRRQCGFGETREWIHFQHRFASMKRKS